MKKVAILVVCLVLLMASLAGGFYMATFAGSQRPSQGPAVGGRFERVMDGIAAIYIVDLGNGKLALMDAGNDKKAEALLQAIKARNKTPEDVVAIFITHSHPDHIASIPAFPNAAVYASKPEVPLAEGRAEFKSTMAKILGTRNKTPFNVTHPLDDGEKVTLGNVTFTAYTIPGHTPGSTAYLVEGALFLGDAANFRSGGTLAGPIGLFSDDAKQGADSLRKLAVRLAEEKQTVDFIVTAHTGTQRGISSLAKF